MPIARSPTGQFTSCGCKIPTLKKAMKRLRENTKCLTCNGRIRKDYVTQNGKRLVLRIANEPHSCNRCEAYIEPGQLYFAMSVKGGDGQFHIWALCYACRTGTE